jgi:hypothetical protein
MIEHRKVALIISCICSAIVELIYSALIAQALKGVKAENVIIPQA